MLEIQNALRAEKKKNIFKRKKKRKKKKKNVSSGGTLVRRAVLALLGRLKALPERINEIKSSKKLQAGI
jgi:hypothetical protein